MDLAVVSLYGGPYGTLVSNVDVGYGSRPWGGTSMGTSAASFLTWWNLHSRITVNAPRSLYAPRTNFVGVNSTDLASPLDW